MATGKGGYGDDYGGYGPQRGGSYEAPTGSGGYERPAAAYGAGTATTTYYGDRPPTKKRFPWVILVVLSILAVVLVLSLTKCGIEDTPAAYYPPKPPQYTPTTVYVPPTTVPPITNSTVIRTG